jgi:hypothetical protein
MCNMGGTRETAVLSAVAHAAQWQWTHDVPHDPTYFTEAFACIAVKSDERAAAIKSDIAEGIRHASWQRRWKVAFDVCGDKNVAHDIASRTQLTSEAYDLAMQETA